MQSSEALQRVVGWLGTRSSRLFFEMKFKMVDVGEVPPRLSAGIWTAWIARTVCAKFEPHISNYRNKCWPMLVAVQS
jgi:hypothetical protein